ncbi:unnamed protein product [Lactuca virosa]|uniref:Uncharacterized protein n=1 Tax=Lactuca virosa TaxID=75947 RepID=A0AAU9PQV7_9ASTR|nr:unnamed protein product [Lactuca virosa]
MKVSRSLFFNLFFRDSIYQSINHGGGFGFRYNNRIRILRYFVSNFIRTSQLSDANIVKKGYLLLESQFPPLSPTHHNSRKSKRNTIKMLGFFL